LRRILDRYILKELFLSWFAVTGVLLVILLTFQVAKVLERAAESQYPQSVVLELIWLSALQNLAVITPVGSVKFEGGEWDIHGRESGPIALKIRETLLSIQHGNLPDRHGWMHSVC